MEIYSVDSTESRENKKTSSSKIIPQVGFDLRTSGFRAVHATTGTSQSAVSLRDLNPYI